jgi:hypothetical protein
MSGVITAIITINTNILLRSTSTAKELPGWVPSEPVIYVAASEQFDNVIGIAEHLEITFLCSSPDNEVKSLFVINKFTI